MLEQSNETLEDKVSRLEKKIESLEQCLFLRMEHPRDMVFGPITVDWTPPPIIGIPPVVC